MKIEYWARIIIVCEIMSKIKTLTCFLLVFLLDGFSAKATEGDVDEIKCLTATASIKETELVRVQAWPPLSPSFPKIKRHKSRIIAVSPSSVVDVLNKVTRDCTSSQEVVSLCSQLADVLTSAEFEGSSYWENGWTKCFSKIPPLGKGKSWETGPRKWAMFVTSILWGWSIMAGTWNIWTIEGFGEIQGIPVAYADYNHNTPAKDWFAMLVQTFMTNPYLIVVSAMQSWNMFHGILQQIHYQSDTENVPQWYKRVGIRLWAFTKSLFPQKEEVRWKRFWLSCGAVLYGMIDALPELVLLVESLNKDFNIGTAIGVPAFYIGNIYERWEPTKETIDNILGRFYSGKTPIIKQQRKTLVKIMEQARFNIDEMNDKDISTYNTVLDELLQDGIFTTNPMVDRSEQLLPPRYDRIMMLLLFLGTDTTFLVRTQNKKESWARKSAKIFGAAVGLATTWGSYVLMKGVVEKIGEDWDENTVNIIGPMAGAVAGILVRGVMRNVKNGMKAFTAMFDGWTQDTHFKRTGEYNPYLDSSISPQVRGFIRLFHYFTGIYFSAPLVSILWPIIKDWDPTQRTLLLATFFAGDGNFSGHELDRHLRDFIEVTHHWNYGCFNSEKHAAANKRSRLRKLIHTGREMLHLLPDPLISILHENHLGSIAKKVSIEDEAL